MAISVEELLKILDEGLLLSAEDIAELRSAIPAGTLHGEADQLTRELVRRKKLTNYQASAVIQGKARSLVVGNYIVVDKLGRGGMAMVFKAKHLQTGQIVALKVLPRSAIRTSVLLKRFQREIAATSALNHQNIVEAIDVDNSNESHETHFLAMEYIDGQDLQSLVKEGKPVTVQKAVNYTVQAALGLAHAHHIGITHRDIKPSNLMLDSRGTIKILDLGLARFDDALSMEGNGALEGLTQTGRIVGTVDYMSPEQALDTKHVDHRTDIYSLGCTLYFLLTGKTLYGGDTIMKKLLAHRQNEVPSLRRRRKDVPERLDTVFQRMVAKDRSNRFQTMDEVVESLDSVFDEEPEPDADELSLSDVDLEADAEESAFEDDALADISFEPAGLPPRVQSGRPKTSKKRRRTPQFGDLASHALQQMKPFVPAGALIAGVLLLVGASFWVTSLFSSPAEEVAAPAPEVEPQFQLRQEITVGPEADFETIGQAIAFVHEHFDPAVNDWKTQTIRVAGGQTYKESISIDNSNGSFPEGLVLTSAESEPARLLGNGVQPVISLTNVKHVTLNGFEIDARRSSVAVSISGTLPDTQLQNLAIHGFSKSGILIDGDTGQQTNIHLNRLVFSGGAKQAAAIRCRLGDGNRAALSISQCRVFGPLQTGISLESGFRSLRIGECVFTENETAVRFLRAARLGQSVRIVNNTFHRLNGGIVFEEQPAGMSIQFQVCRNLFAGLQGSEALVQQISDPDALSQFMRRHGEQCLQNWSSRRQPRPPVVGELDLFGNEGRRGLTELAFASQTHGDAAYLAPLSKAANPLPDIPGMELQPYIGAKAPDSSAQPLRPSLLVRRFEGHAAAIHSAMIGRDGLSVLTASGDQTIRRWNLQTGELLSALTGHDEAVVALAMSPTGRSLVTGSRDQTARIWNLQDGREVRRLDDAGTILLALAWSPDGRFILSGGEDGLVRVWNAETGQPIRQFEGHAGPVRCVGFSHFGHTAFSASDDGSVRFWNTHGGKQLLILEGHQGAVRSAAVSSDGQTVVTGSSDKTVRLWDVVTGREKQQFTGHEAAVTSVALSPGGRHILSGSLDATVRVWNVEQGTESLRFDEHFGDVSTVRFSPEGRFALTAGGDCSACLWDLQAAGVDDVVPLPNRTGLPATEITNSIGMRLLLIPAGEFQMGSPETEAERHANERRHSVRITRSFYLGAFEVTQQEFLRVTQRNSSTFHGSGPNRQQLPVETVSWQEAKAFCEKLSQLPEERAARRSYRLPTEAQWEFACRSGTTTPFVFGKSLDSRQANIDGLFPYGTSKKGPLLGKTAVVGSYRPNFFGLFDMHGNVAEWCTDVFEADFYQTSPRENPLPRDTASLRVGGVVRVVRGGSWASQGDRCRSASRGRKSAIIRGRSIGFRVVCKSR